MPPELEPEPDEEPPVVPELDEPEPVPGVVEVEVVAGVAEVEVLAPDDGDEEVELESFFDEP